MESTQGPLIPSPDPPSQQRPGCITLYAVFLALSGVAYVALALFLSGSVLFEGPDYLLMALLFALCLTAFATVPLITALGLWRMRRWAWWLVVLLHSMGILFSLLTLCGILTIAQTSEIVASVAGTLVGILISIYILRWFFRNRERFGAKTVVGPGGDVVAAPSSNTEILMVTVAGVVILVILAGCAAIALLTLMGPQIGNVFSQITSGLEVTPAGP